MNWKTVRLELAGTRDFPAGSVSRGYLVRIPLKDTGSIDEESFAETPQKATVRRFWSTEPDQKGSVVRSDGHWALRCNGQPDRLLSRASDSFVLGEEVALVGAHGMCLPFRVANIRSFG
jgi:hypothetical protein